jgi:hypothetical protein
MKDIKGSGGAMKSKWFWLGLVIAGMPQLDQIKGVTNVQRRSGQNRGTRSTDQQVTGVSLT